MEPRYRLIDGFERSNRHSETFVFPGFETISQLQAGDYVKIGVEFPPDRETGHDGERFWVGIVSAFSEESDTCFTGVIDNDLRFSSIHGLRLGDEIAFEPNHILAIGNE